MMANRPLLVINTGSSSLKLGVYVAGDGDEQMLFDGLAGGIGQQNGSLVLRDAKGTEVRSDALHAASEADALREMTGWLEELLDEGPCAIGHRIVHGGPKLVEHQRITGEVLEELQRCIHFAPLHLPVALELIAAAEQSFPGVPQFACFDTAFHATMPESAKRFALPRELYDEGVRRYGFHGLSYESIVRSLGETLRPRTVVAHLGNGASVCAVEEGRSIDTSMGLTPTGGVPMGTRSGDLDPGVILFLLQTKDLNADVLEEMLNRESGLRGISGGTSDMRELEAAAGRGEQAAALAIEMFCTAVAKTVAGYAVDLGGLEMLVFTGGIGEHSAMVRGLVGRKLAVLGVAMDDSRNESPDAPHGLAIAAEGSRVQVQVVASEEDRQIARHTRRMLAQTGPAKV